MNFLGKIFVVLILISSIVFVALAAVVYATHRNWEAKAKQVQQQLAEERQRFDAARSEYDRANSELDRQISAQVQQLRKLQSEAELLAARNQQIQEEVDQLTATNREAVASVTATEEFNSKIAGENETLRSEIRTAQNKTDVAFRKALSATERLNAVVGELEIVGERNEQLTQQVGEMTVVMRENGLDPATPADAVKPQVDGFVSATRRRGGEQYVEVTIGSDDGLRVDHTVEVFRGGKYLGRVRILKTAPDRSYGRIDRNFQEGRIKEGDRVATRLKLG
ncbi:MAG: hypothetical protein AAF790_06580 [Planctomycetota bacterium]